MVDSILKCKKQEAIIHQLMSFKNKEILCTLCVLNLISSTI